ncbi:hypothetical protein CU097_002999, partial [Rhizopus azygosporus]
PLSRSFDEQSISDLTDRDIKNQRPMSMMGIDKLLQEDNKNLIGRPTNNEKRKSLIVIKEGYLFKKTDFRPFHKQAKLDRGWKLYKVVLRGHKLYLFKVTAESPLRSLFPSSPSLSISSSNHDLSTAASLKLVSSEFDRDAQQTLFYSSIDPAQGQIFMELNPVNMQAKRSVQLVVHNGCLYVCYRPDKKQLWTIEEKIPIQQLKLTQISSITDLIDSPTSPSSIKSHQSDPSYQKQSNVTLFNISYVNKPLTLGVYSTQYHYAAQAWIQLFQNNNQRKPPFLEEDLFSSKSNGSTEYYESLHPSETSINATIPDLEPSNDGRMYDATQRHHPDLLHKSQLDDDEIILGGTVTALVQELLMTDNEEYVNTFLLTYSTFTTGSCVLDEIGAFLTHSPGKFDNHLLDIFSIWCNKFALDIMGDVATDILSLLDHIDSTDTSKIKELVLNTVAENAKNTAFSETKYQTNDLNDEEEMETTAMENIPAEGGGSVNLSNLLITGLTPALFLRICPDKFAEQVYLFHLTQYTKHKQALMDPLSYVPRPQISAEMLNSLLFTTASPHFLTKLIRNHILIDSQQEQPGTDGVLLRSRLLNHWISVGMRLYELGDATGWCAVAMGLCSVGIVRLREAWKLVKRDLVSIVLQWTQILTDHGLFEQSFWSDSWEKDLKFAHVLDLGHSQTLPFFGPIRQAVDRQRKHLKKLLMPNVINFEKCSCIYKTIQTSLQAWTPKQPRVVDVQTVGPLQSFFEHSITDLASVPHDFKYLQECSIACEPKIFGQTYDRHRFFQDMPGIAPPSTSILQFPVILESCMFWDNESKRTANESPGIIPPYLNDNKSSKQVNQLSNVVEEAVSTPSRSTGRATLRKRTYSFPPGTALNTDDESYGNEILEAINSKTWLGSIAAGRQHCTYSTKALIEAHWKSRGAQLNDGEVILTVEQEKLAFKVSAILRSKGSKDNLALKRTDSLSSVNILKEEDNNVKGNNTSLSKLLVTVKNGHLVNLIECLVNGVTPYYDTLKEQWQMITLTEGLRYQIDRIIMNETDFMNVFFTAYRSYSSTMSLLTMLQKKFMDAKLNSKLTAKRKNPSLTLLETYFPSDKAKQDMNATQQQGDKDSIEVKSYDWKQVASTQMKIIDLLLYWIDEHPYDFIDEPQSLQLVNIFLRKAQDNLDSWRAPLERYLLNENDGNVNDDEIMKRRNLIKALNISNEIREKIHKLEYRFIQTSLIPCYDMKSIEFNPECLHSAEEVYHELMQGSQFYVSTLQLATSDRTPLSVSPSPVDPDAASLVDRYPPEVLLEQVDKCVCQLFEAATFQDWAQTFDILEVQCNDLYAWLPARKPSRLSKLWTSFAVVSDAPSFHVSNYHVPADEVVISDIFTAIQGAKRPVVSPSAFSDDDFLLAFPSSIQYLYCMHLIIRSWAIQEMTSLKTDVKTRISRIKKFLHIVLLSKMCSEEMSLFPELKGSESVTKKRVPGFVENAIASALVSPEVRLFTKAWNDIALQYGHSSLDSLENLLNKMKQSMDRKEFSTLASFPKSQSVLVPSLGWIFERVIEICFSMPDAVDKKDTTINFDKRRYLYHFLHLIINVQMDINEKRLESKGLSMSFLISPNTSNTSWRELKEYAVLESRKNTSQGSSSGKGLRGPSSKSHASKTTIFSVLVAKQTEKLKRDFKERDRIDKGWLTFQHKQQKKQLEQARAVERHERPQSMMPRLNSFFKGLRPPSLVSSPIHHIFPISNNHDQLAATKASTVINLIHSTTSVASTYMKRDFVFRIVTEEGGQYLFQAMNREDMYDWMRQINDTAREGAAKRQSILIAESMDNESERRQSAVLLTASRSQTISNRKSVYGVPLDVLMRDGQVPMIVEKCIKEIERRGLEEVGIYRVAGTGSIVTALKAEFNKDVNKVDLSDPRWADINVIADAFKQFLRELPEPLLTYTYYDEFINASASEDHDQRVYLIKEVLKKLPYSNYTLLKKIIEHFITVTDFEGINHMYATNLAIVFGPTLLQPAPGPASFATTMSNLGHHQNIVKYLILNYHYLFDVENEAVETKDDQA